MVDQVGQLGSHGRCWGRCFDGKTPTGLHVGSKENLFLDGELQHLHIGDLGIACMPLDAKKNADSEMRCKA